MLLLRTSVRLLMCHRAAACVLLAAAAIRLVVMAAYRPAFWFPDSRGYLDAAHTLIPFTNQQLGYAIFLKVFHIGDITLAVVSGLQHLLTLGLAVLCYAFLQRRNCPKWLSVLAIVPVLFDSTRLTLEHYIMSDTLFVTLLMTGVIALLWQTSLPYRIAWLAGSLIGLASITRLVAVPVALLLLLALMVTRVGWRQVAAFGLAVATPLLAYMVLYHHHHGVFALSQFQGSFLYGRVSNFVDCAKLELRPELRRMCPYESIDRRLYPDYYFWSAGAPRNFALDPPSDKLIYEFATEAIKQQPGDYARTVLTDLWHFVDPTWVPDYRSACYATRYQLPVDTRQRQSPNWGCQTLIASSNHSLFVEEPASGNNWLTRSLNWYSRHTTVPGPLVGFAALLVLAALWRIRSRPGFEAVLMGACGISLVVIATATVMFEWRYLQPALIPMWIGAALAVQAFREHHAARHPVDSPPCDHPGSELAPAAPKSPVVCARRTVGSGQDDGVVPDIHNYVYVSSSELVTEANRNAEPITTPCTTNPQMSSSSAPGRR